MSLCSLGNMRCVKPLQDALFVQVVSCVSVKSIGFVSVILLAVIFLLVKGFLAYMSGTAGLCRGQIWL